jgi:hypothetical protein
MATNQKLIQKKAQRIVSISDRFDFYIEQLCKGNRIKTAKFSSKKKNKK